MDNQSACKRPSRSADELKADFHTVLYEVKMLLSVADVYGRLGNPQSLSILDISRESPEKTTIGNALVESFAIHYRALIFFLFGHLGSISSGDRNPVTETFAQRRCNDVIALDYNERWCPECPDLCNAIVDSKRKADKEIAHITTERRNLNQSDSDVTPEWQIGSVAAEIAFHMNAFLESIPNDIIDAGSRLAMKSLLAPWLLSHNKSLGTDRNANNTPSSVNPAICGKTTSSASMPDTRANTHGCTE